MKSIVLVNPGVLEQMNIPEPGKPAFGEVLVRVHRIGICGTDIHAFRGKQPFFSYPRRLGHELGVEILECGPGVTGLNPGDRCAVEPYFHCGKCIACRDGKFNCCVNIKVFGVHIDGGMLERVILPAAKCHPANDLSYEALALVETLAIGCHAVSRAALSPRDTALVIGAGPIGLAVMQFARLAGSRVIAMDISSTRLEICRKIADVDATIPAGDLAMNEFLAANGGDPATVVFDATGNAASMERAIHYLAHGGRLVFVGLFVGSFSLEDPEFHRRETTLLGSRNALPADFTRILEYIRRGRLDASAWITHRAPLEQAPEHMPNWIKPETGVLKAMLEV